ncbi:MAG: DedA family protein [Fimbriimonas sp.]
MLEGLIQFLKAWTTSVIHTLGYPGIFLLMMLDAANIPIPSEVIMPVGGILAAEGKMNLHLAALAGTLGATVGSMISYWVGMKLGKPFLLKYGKYVLLRPKEIEHAEEWFVKHGLIVTLWGRFVPLVRTFISLPAGFFRANFPLFCFYAFLGSLPWSYLWTWLGFKLGENWETVEKNMKFIDFLVVGAILFVFGRLAWRRIQERKLAAVPETD